MDTWFISRNVKRQRKDLEIVPSLFGMMSSWTFGTELLNLKTNIWFVPKILDFDKFTPRPQYLDQQKILIPAIVKQILREKNYIIWNI